MSTSDTMGVLQNTGEKEVLFLQQHFTADKQLVNPRAKQRHRQVGGCILINRGADIWEKFLVGSGIFIKLEYACPLWGATTYNHGFACENCFRKLKV